MGGGSLVRMGNVRTRCYRAGVLDAEDFPLADVSERLAEPDTVVWVDFVHPAADDLAGLAGELDLHAMAIEDALEPHQRSKIDRYPSHLFLSCHAVHFDRDHLRLDTTEVDAFIGRRWVVTVRSSDLFAIDPALRRWDSEPKLVAKGPGFLVYGVLDDIVDGYFAALEHFDEYYERVSDDVFSDRPLRPDQQREWFEMRRTLAHFHKLVLPLREALSGLVRREHDLVDPDVVPYWEDLYDHVIVVSQTTDAMRDLVSSLVDANLSLRDYRQNQVVKRVSSWAAIVAAPTLITGYYGMNVPFPGSGETVGVVVSALLIFGVTVFLYLQFRSRDWL
jgi:magnesium transporter